MKSPSGFHGLHAGPPPDAGRSRPVPLPDVECPPLADLAANAGRVLTYERLLERVWGKKGGGDTTCVFAEPRVG